jgi:hypothetical protein
MPDGDVFNRRVRRGWQTASQRMIGGGEGHDALPSVLRALGREVKATGCPGIDRVVGAVAGGIRSSQPVAARRLALAELERLRVDHGNHATEIAIGSGRRLLAGVSEPERSAMLAMDNGELRAHLATMILADLADAAMCPAGLLPQLVEEGGVSFQEFRVRRQQNKELIVAAPEARRMAIQLLADPSGASVKAPRIRRERLSQAEILTTALTH